MFDSGADGFSSREGLKGPRQRESSHRHSPSTARPSPRPPPPTRRRQGDRGGPPQRRLPPSGDGDAARRGGGGRRTWGARPGPGRRRSGPGATQSPRRPAAPRPLLLDPAGSVCRFGSCVRCLGASWTVSPALTGGKLTPRGSSGGARELDLSWEIRPPPPLSVGVPFLCRSDTCLG